MKPPLFIVLRDLLLDNVRFRRSQYKRSVHSHIDCLLKVHTCAVNRYYRDAMAPCSQSELRIQGSSAELGVLNSINPDLQLSHSVRVCTSGYQMHRRGHGISLCRRTNRH
jgi:hypothetical protein